MALGQMSSLAGRHSSHHHRGEVVGRGQTQVFLGAPFGLHTSSWGSGSGRGGVCCKYQFSSQEFILETGCSEVFHRHKAV